MKHKGRTPLKAKRTVRFRLLHVALAHDRGLQAQVRRHVLNDALHDEHGGEVTRGPVPHTRTQDAGTR